MCRGGVVLLLTLHVLLTLYLNPHFFPRLVEIFTFVSNLDERKVGVWLDLKLSFWKVESHFLLDKENGHNEPRACGAGWGMECQCNCAPMHTCATHSLIQSGSKFR